METLPAERKALLFSAGGVRLALRLSQVREIVAVAGDADEVRVRGGAVPLVPLARLLGLGAAPGGHAVVTEAPAPMALRVEALHGIVDVASAEFFRLPARTQLPRPAPFAGAFVVKGEIALELVVGALSPEPIEPAQDGRAAPPEAPAPRERELYFARERRTFAVPLSLLVQVLERARVAPVPLAPPAHRGLLYHGRAIHPVLDVAAVYGDPTPRGDPGTVLLVDAGGTAAGLVADRVLGVGEGRGEPAVQRPSWDALFAP